MSEWDPEPDVDDVANRTARALRALAHGIRIGVVRIEPASFAELRIAAREVLALESADAASEGA